MACVLVLSSTIEKMTVDKGPLILENVGTQCCFSGSAVFIDIPFPHSQFVQVNEALPPGGVAEN